MKKAAPWLLIGLRVLLAPVLLALVHGGLIGDRGFLAIYLLAFATDYLDGNVARWLDVATPRLRAADSAADTVFHVAVALGTLELHPDDFRTPALLAFLGTAALWYGLDAIRWKRVAGFHSRISRAFAVAILAWVIVLYGFGVHGELGWALAVGVAANVEGVAISLLLREDRKDVPTILDAVRARTSQAA
jgi:phosphatidylglycerophosphate synthase